MANADTAFSAIEDLASTFDPTYYVLGSPETAWTANDPPKARRWPNIAVPISITKTAKWVRDMGEIVRAIPPKEAIDFLVDHFFEDVQTHSACCFFDISLTSRRTLTHLQSTFCTNAFSETR